MADFLTTVLACLVLCGMLAYTDGYCFRYRNPLGKRGTCQELVERLPGRDGDPVETRDACCLLGAGEGWSEKLNGKKCVAACEEPEDEPGVAGQAGAPLPEDIQEVAAQYEEEADQNMVEGVWGSWSDWQPCSVTCDRGFLVRRRECNPSPDHLDDNFQCSGDRVEHRECNTDVPCPVHGLWSEWTAWSECSATCGDTTVRYRECDSPSPEFGGNRCVGASQEVEWCNNNRHCPIHGGWREWLNWSPCSATCGRGGERRRIRKCTAPKPRYGGQDCDGDHIDIQPCKAKNLNCPVDGGVSEWGAWKCPSKCSHGGTGYGYRSRTCTNPKPQHGGRQCREPLIDALNCSLVACSVDGMWSSWGEWNECSATCGMGRFKSRLRECNNPPPQDGGLPCPGDPYENKNCEKISCPDSDSSYVPSSESGLPCDDEDTEGGSGCTGVSSSEGSGSDFNDVTEEPPSSLLYEDY